MSEFKFIKFVFEDFWNFKKIPKNLISFINLRSVNSKHLVEEVYAKKKNQKIDFLVSFSFIFSLGTQTLQSLLKSNSKRVQFQNVGSFYYKFLNKRSKTMSNDSLKMRENYLLPSSEEYSPL